MTNLLAQRSAQLKSAVWSRIKPMRELQEQCPEILELSAKADIIASVFCEIASLKDTDIASREAVRNKVKSVEFLVDEMNETFQSLMAV